VVSNFQLTIKEVKLWKVNHYRRQSSVVHVSMIDWWRIFPSATDFLKIQLNDTGVTVLPQK
jgi:hypothetical protein